MGSISKSYGYDAGKRDPKNPRTVFVNGERRAEKWPAGVTERFVNLQGNVVSIQLVPPGTAPTPDAIAKKRNEMHLMTNADKSVQGFIEHHKCPLRHGIRHLTTLIEEEFAGMPTRLQTACTTDPVTVVRGPKGAREYRPSCSHIEWLIESRREREKERRAQRGAREASVIEMERKKLELAEQQAAESRELNKKLATVVEQAVSKQPRKALAE